MNKFLSSIFILIFITFSISGNSLSLLYSETDNLRYFAANSEPDSTWYTFNFNDSAWPEDSAIVGFGYGDQGYTIIDQNAKSLYTRFSFEIENKENIKCLNFVVDYDDGYVAYLNGVEIARVNVDKSIVFPPFDAHATRSHASELAYGLTSPVLGIYLDSTFLSTTLKNGKNIIAVHILNDTEESDLLYIPILYDISKTTFNFTGFIESRYKRLVDIDSTDLPLVILDTDQYGISYYWRTKMSTTASMSIINNGEGNFNKPGDASNEYNGLISIHSRGQSSRDFVKKSYKFKLIDAEGKDTSFSLMGMPEESEWILIGPFADKSQIRNKLAYDLGNLMGNWAPRTKFCELIVNGQLEGLYNLTEEIKRGKNRVNISKLRETDIAGFDVTGGYIFKYDKNDPNQKKRYKGREIVYPDSLNTAQATYLTRFFTVYDSILKTNDFLDQVKGFRKYASDTSLVDYIIISELIKNADSYVYSTYMYKDRDDKGGRMKFGPMWDYDLGFGNTEFQAGNRTDGWQFEINTTMKITRYLEDRKMVELLQNRWTELRKSTFSIDSIFNLMDNLLAQIQTACKRNYVVWPVIDQWLFYPGHPSGSYEYEIAYMRDWLEKRLEWIDNNISNIYYPLKLTDNKELASISDEINLRVFPNPFVNNLSIDFNIEEESDIKIEIYNITGQIKYQVNMRSISGYNEVALDDTEVSSLQKGMYMVRIFINNAPVKTVKVIKR